jgi:hypothetical protein
MWSQAQDSSALAQYLYNHFGLFYSAHVRAEVLSKTVIPLFFPLPFIVSHTSCVPRSQSPYAVTVVTCAVLFSCILLFMILVLDSIMESKRKYKNYDKTEGGCKVMTLDGENKDCAR